MGASKWEDLRARLLALGWRDETAEGITGMSSPNDAMFIDASILDAGFRATTITSLTRQVATIEGYREQGFYPPETERAHRDFRQAIEVLSGIGDE